MRDITPKKKNRIKKLEVEKKNGSGKIEITKGVFVAWQAPEYEYRRKDVSWYWLSLILAIILLALSLWQKNFLFAIFVVIAWLVIVNQAARFPLIWNFKIDEKGIGIADKEGNDKFYPYTDIDFFDIHIGGNDYKELVLKFKPRLTPLLKINIHSEDEEKINGFLLKYLPRKEVAVSLIDSLSKLIRF